MGTQVNLEGTQKRPSATDIDGRDDVDLKYKVPLTPSTQLLLKE